MAFNWIIRRDVNDVEGDVGGTWDFSGADQVFSDLNWP